MRSLADAGGAWVCRWESELEKSERFAARLRQQAHVRCWAGFSSLVESAETAGPVSLSRQIEN